MNAGEDQIGFLIVPSGCDGEMIIGVTVEAGQFICFRYNKQWTHQVLGVQGGDQILVGGYRQVIAMESRKKGETFIVGLTTEFTINIFTFDSKSLQITLLKEMKQNVDCITPS